MGWVAHSKSSFSTIDPFAAFDVMASGDVVLEVYDEELGLDGYHYMY